MLNSPSLPNETSKLHAERARLIYVNPDEPGLARRHTPRGFRYLDPFGKTVRDRESVERIRALVIPPAWADVWISAEPDGHIQATGRDIKGRKQYLYHKRWAECRDEVKFSSLTAFAERLPRIRAAIDHDLRRRTLSRDRVVAAVVWLLDNALIRIGNPAYVRENGSFGLTTLRDRHVEIAGSGLRFAFKGKSGKEWRLKLSDRRIARVVKAAQDLPGQQLFQFLDEDGQRRSVKSEDVNAYIRDAAGADFSSKHFRTWGGTVLAACALAAAPYHETLVARRRTLNAAIDSVASLLNNTRTVCRGCYIHPAVIQDFEDGSIGSKMTDARRSFRKLPDGLDEAEMTVLRWIGRRNQ